MGIGTAWAAPAVVLASSAPAYAASLPPAPNCPTLVNSANCNWNYNGVDASAYFINSRFTQNISASGGTFPSGGDWSGSENN